MKKHFTFRSVLIAIVALAIGTAAVLLGHTPTHMAPSDSIAFVGFGGLIVNRDSLNAMFTGFKTAFSQAFSGVQPMWNKVATLVPSTAKQETYGWIGQFPNLREWVGDRQVKSLAASSYQIVNKKFEASVGVPRDDIEDDSYGVLSPVFASMGQAAATHPDTLVFPLLAAGFANICFDGQYFFDTDHPVGAGVVSNMVAGAGNPWFLLDTSRPLKPIIFQKRREYDLKAMTDANDEAVFMRDEYRYGVDARGNVGYGFWQMAFGSKATLDAAAFDAATAAMMSFKSDEGAPLGIKPTILVVGPSNRAAAKALIAAEKLANGASNTNFQAVELYVCEWLA